MWKRSHTRTVELMAPIETNFIEGMRYAPFTLEGIGEMWAWLTFELKCKVDRVKSSGDGALMVVTPKNLTFDIERGYWVLHDVRDHRIWKARHDEIEGKYLKIDRLEMR